MAFTQVLFVLAASGNGAAALAPSSAFRTATEKPMYTYVSEAKAALIDGYREANRKNREPFCSLSLDMPAWGGLATDGVGDLYASTYDASFAEYGILEFGPRCGNVLFFYPVLAANPIDVAIDDSTVYVSNAFLGASQPGAVFIYQQGNPTKIGELLHPSVASGFGIAVDARHDVFWATTNKSGSGQVVEFVGGAMPGHVLPKTISGDFPGGVLLDNNANLLFVDQTSNSINVFAAPRYQRVQRSIHLTGTAFFCAFGSNTSLLLCADYQYGRVDVYAYQTGAFLYSYAQGLEYELEPLGIATASGT